MTNTNRATLVESYINAMIDSMTLEEMQELLYALIESDLEDLDDEQLIREVNFTHPELLGAS